MFKFQHTYAELSSSFYALVKPTPVPSPKLIQWNASLAETLGMGKADIHPEELAAVFSGNTLPEGAQPLAQAYGGHQFGHFNKLGDGRAILLGEHQKPNGESVDIQLKGSGPTPYSRRGDGRGSLAAMLREYIISEAMFHLGIPTSRSLAVVATGQYIQRQQMEKGGILTRVNQSHLRVGTFEYARYFLTEKEQTALLNYAIQRHYPELLHAENPALAFVQKVMEQHIELVVNWMRVGFIHGVMNTDNVTISGETIDYGPCAFMNVYHPKTVFSSIDTQGRYAYGNQPAITQWNISCLAGALLPLIHPKEPVAIDMAQQLLNSFPELFKKAHQKMLANKLGFTDTDEEINQFIQQFLGLLQAEKVDFTNAFLYLEDEAIFEEQSNQGSLLALKESWKKLLKEKGIVLKDAFSLMREKNPVIIARNHLVEEALSAASQEDNLAPFNKLLALLAQPYNSTNLDKKYQFPPENIDQGYQTFCGT